VRGIGVGRAVGGPAVAGAGVPGRGGGGGGGARGAGPRVGGGGGRGRAAGVGGRRWWRGRADVARLGQAVGAAAVGDGEAHRVAARRGVGVDRVLGGRAGAVAEVPRPGGGGTGGLIG